MKIHKALLTVGLPAALVAATIPQLAWAAGEANTLTGLFQDMGLKTNDLVSAAAIAIASIVAACALLSILLEVVKLLFSNEKVTFSTHIANCVKIIGVCIFAGVAVLLVNGAINFFSGGLNLGSISGLTPAES